MQDELHQLLGALCQCDRGVKGDAATFLGLKKREAGKAAAEGAARSAVRPLLRARQSPSCPWVESGHTLK